MHEYTMANDREFTDYEKRIVDMVIEGGAIYSLRYMKHNSFPKVLREIGFVSVKEQDISRYTEPSFRRLHRLSIIPYFFVKLFGLQKRFINVTAGYEGYKIAKKGLGRYCIFTAKKPN